MDSREKSLWCAHLAIDKKAVDVVIAKVKEQSSFSDYFIICSGNSDRHVKGIAYFIEMSFKKKGIVALGMEGLQEGKWILMDYGDIIVHVFYQPVREFYNLEKLWIEAPRIAMDAVGEETQNQAKNSSYRDLSDLTV